MMQAAHRKFQIILVIWICSMNTEFNQTQLSAGLLTFYFCNLAHPSCHVLNLKHFRLVLGLRKQLAFC